MIKLVSAQLPVIYTVHLMGYAPYSVNYELPKIEEQFVSLLWPGINWVFVLACRGSVERHQGKQLLVHG